MSLMDEQTDGTRFEAHREFFREVLLRIYQVMEEKFGLRSTTVRPMMSDGSRLSIPIRIEGVDMSGQKVQFFGKIIGSSNLMTARTIQFFKNVYLRMNSMDPLFEVIKSTEDLARHQHEMLVAINDLGIPTAKPYGVFPLQEGLWLLVAEFLDAEPISPAKGLSEEHLDMVFGYLRKMHKAGIFHGDIKPDNLMLGDRLYIVDVGHFMKDVPTERRMAYDLACEIASFLEYMPVEDIVEIAGRHYSDKVLRAAAEYIDLIQRRPDINFTDETKDELVEFLRTTKRRRKPKTRRSKNRS